jgi:hypothetical protein
MVQLSREQIVKAGGCEKKVRALVREGPPRRAAKKPL